MTAEGEAGEIVGIDGPGALLVNGAPAAVGRALQLGDSVETHGAQAVLERQRPGELTLALERGTRAEVTHVRGPLILALVDGAVEAQVVPVTSGEAFAVDVDRSRIAVHGTHLRVERHGDAVVIDLAEGVVSVGAAPRTGSTTGALVTAPAHAEFSAAAAEETLVVTHDAAAVRAPGLAITVAHASAPVPPAAALAGPKPAPAEPRVAAPSAPQHPEPAHVAPPAQPPAAEPVGAPNAAASLAGEVRRCMTERTHTDGVTVVVSTTLHLQVNDDGSVRAARFDPPVAPDVNACAATSIYKTRFAHGGAVAIPVDVRVPSSAP
jgi:hypothetical protein